VINTGIDQRTDEWYAARLGKATASRFKDIITKTKSGSYGAGRKNYRAELLVERLTGRSSERFTSAAMDWGTTTEELARTRYELRTRNFVEEVGFLQHDELLAGASPDGLVGEDGQIEIKCYNTANHIEALRSGQMPPEHMAQVQGQLWITGRKWCDFISFDPELPAQATIFIQRIPRDDTYIAMLETEIRSFLTELAATSNLSKAIN
jgi:putative phage-type endonuclease